MFVQPATDLSWMDDAECRLHPEVTFFPERGEQDVARRAKAVCRACPVQVQCLEYAESVGEKFGVWGGVSVEDRRKRRRRKEPGLGTATA